MGGGKVRSQNKFKHAILAPFRIMRKAKGFYMKGMEELAGRVSQGGGVGGPAAAQVPTVPRSFSKRREDDEDYRELLRSVSKRNSDQRQQPAAMGAPGPNGMGLRSYSVGIGKIGRIDEDELCEFQEVNPRAGSLYPRSRSQAVGRRNVVLY